MKSSDNNVGLCAVRTFFEKWKAIFENSPVWSVDLQCDDTGYLTLDGCNLCLASEVCPETVVVDVECIEFDLTDKSTIYIDINWPFASLPEIVGIERVFAIK